MYGSMTIKLVISVVAVLLLSATHWKAYVIGRNEVLHQWQQETLKSEQAARQKEQQLVVAKNKAEKKYVDEKRKAAVAASSASNELEQLRKQLTTDKDNSDSCPVARTNGGAKLERDILGHCATTLVQLAAEADRLEAVVVGLQSYIKNVCLEQGK